QPGSLRETVYVRAVLDGAVPEVRQRTSALRQDLDRGRALEREARSALASLRIGENDLQTRRRELQNVEANQRLASRDARAIAARERELALALAEDARDLDGLIGELDNAAKLRRELAALPGPIMRPARPRDSSVPGNPRPAASAGATVAPAGFRLPVQGRTIVGFGAPMDSGLRSNGVEIAPAPGAQIVAPAAGRVAFSGPYRGFGRIVIIEHEGGWTSLVTGMEEASVEVGDTLVGGSPLGQAPGSQPVVSIELRRDGEPVNPLEFLD
ncbi:MAG: peptidoglycan DD-metalloendopeptidase family protein, partial [Pseudomonadota bacterium]